MESMHKLCEMLEKELDKIVQRGDINSANLQIIDQLTHSLKSIKAIEAMDEGEEYSHDGYSRRGGYSNRRDSMGRYSREGGSYDGYSREGNSMRGYSWDDGRDRMISQIERLRDMATSEAEKDALRKAIQVVEGQR